VNLIEHIDGLLLEMFVHGSSNPENGSTVIAFRKDIWVFDRKTKKIPPDIWSEMIKATKRGENPFPDSAGNIQLRRGEAYVSEFARRPDVLVGEVRQGGLEIVGHTTFQLDPRSSVLIKKVVKALGLRGAVRGKVDDESSDDFIPKSDIKGKVPSVMYHGTSADHLFGILSKGLRPGQARSNWLAQGVEHKDRIFMAQSFLGAMEHAGMTGQKTGSPAVVIEFTVPDKAKLVPDYDIDVAAEFTTYRHIGSGGHKHRDDFSTKMSGKSSSMAREMGIWGYLGSVLPQKFRAIYVQSTEVAGSVKRSDMVKLDK